MVGDAGRSAATATSLVLGDVVVFVMVCCIPLANRGVDVGHAASTRPCWGWGWGWWPASVHASVPSQGNLSSSGAFGRNGALAERTTVDAMALPLRFAVPLPLEPLVFGVVVLTDAPIGAPVRLRLP